MTEVEWLTHRDPDALLEFLPGNESVRKLRLFAVACCRSVWRGLPTEYSRQATLVAERYADRAASEQEILAARTAAQSHLDLSPGEPIYDAGYWACESSMELVTTWAARYAANSAIFALAPPGTEPDWSRQEKAKTHERAVQAALFRDIFCNPFRSATCNPAWRTGAVVAMASQMYESRDFSDMPILADALQDAGCDSAEILDHCRGAGPHVRGCWVVDLVLGKV